MTALAAYWGFGTGAEDPNDSCERMLRGQQLYAPDTPSLFAHRDVALGRRLFRTLPEDVHDRGPLVGAGGRWTLVGDVRLDARDELCAELGIAPAESKSLADTAIVMRAIEREDERAIARLVGDFALILWDAREERFILARDFLGQRPLHYHRAKGFFAAASMPKGLHALAHIPREPDEEALAGFLAMFPERLTGSYFRGVERVLPGEMLIVRRDAVERSSFWNFEPKPLRLPPHEYVEATREALDRATGARLRGAGAVIGSQLSGGLDSAAVAATAARLMAPEGKVVAFTAAPRDGYVGHVGAGRFIDETEHAAAVAAQYANMEHVVVRGSANSPIRGLDRNFYLFDRPVLNICNSVWVHDILERSRERGLRVLLTGNRGNLTISHAGLEALADLVAKGRWVTAARQAFQLRRNGTRLRRSAAFAVGPFIPLSLWRIASRLAGREADISDYSAIRSDKAKSIATAAEALKHDYHYQPTRGGTAERLRALRQIDAGNYTKGYLGGWGIDVRDPTSDRRVVELCLSIPAEQFLQGGETRSLARRAFADRLPASVAAESRKGYQAADWHEGFRATLTDVAQELESIERVDTASTFIDLPRMREMLARADQVDWGSPDAERRYRLAFLRGLSAGHFLRRAKGAN